MDDRPPRAFAPWCELEDWFLFMLAVHDSHTVAECAAKPRRDEHSVAIRIAALRRHLTKDRDWEEADL